MRKIGIGLMFVFVMVLFAVEGMLYAVTFTVNTTADSGDGSFRWAIEQANNTPGQDNIEFNIPGSGPHTIQPESEFPVVSDVVVMDGYTQPGASPNTNPVGQGLNTVQKIELDGSNAGDGAHCIYMQQGSEGSTIRGLVIHSFTNWGIALWAGEISIEGCFIGTDVNGEVAMGGTGINIFSSSNTIGGTSAEVRNLISGNSGFGIVFFAPWSPADNQIQGNLIGTDVGGSEALGNGDSGIHFTPSVTGYNLIGGGAGGANVISANGGNGITLAGNEIVIRGNCIGTDVSGTIDLGNESHGISVYGVNNQIGGENAEDGNIIAFNRHIGISMFSSENANNTIRNNSIFLNGDLGIDLSESGVTENDDGDLDEGANHLQNFPVLTSVSTTDVQGILSSTSNTEFTLEFFANTECDPSGNGEGETPLGWIKKTTDQLGVLQFSFQFPYAILAGQYITATATDPDGNTSEFSECIQVEEPCVITITSPNGEETWNAGESNYITWSSEEASGFVVIEYSTDAGELWELVIESTENDGSYEWTVPGTTSDECLVRICDVQEGECCDISDDYFAIHADCDFAVAHIAVSSPVSVYYTTPIRVAITNLSSLDIVPGDAYIDILDEGGETIFLEGPVMMDRLYPDPFFLFPAGDTLYTYAYDWVPEESGQFSIDVWLDVPCDTFSVNDMKKAGPVTVSESGTGFIGYFDQYASDRDTVYPQIEGGPAVRYTIPEDLSGANVHTLYVGAVFEDPETSFWVYLFGPGEDDTTFGEELIEPFEFHPQEVDSTGLIEIDLTVRPDYENLMGLSGDFWIHVKATLTEALGFTSRPVLPDTGVARNWYYVWSSPGAERHNPEGLCQPPGYMDPFGRGWEELVGLDYSTCLQERGDVTRDGKVNVLDVLAVINHILNIVIIEDLETLCRADCNNDTGINVLDALGIANVILGIGECEP